jgi:hypothetical protein
MCMISDTFRVPCSKYFRCPTHHVSGPCFKITCELETRCSIIFEALPTQGRFKSLRDPRPAFNAGHGALKNVVGCGCVLYALLFIRTHDDKERKAQLMLHLKTSEAFLPLVLDKLRAASTVAPQAVGP